MNAPLSYDTLYAQLAALQAEFYSKVRAVLPEFGDPVPLASDEGTCYITDSREWGFMTPEERHLNYWIDRVYNDGWDTDHELLEALCKIKRSFFEPKESEYIPEGSYRDC